MAARPFVLHGVAEATGYPAGMIRQELQFAKGVLDHLGLDEEDVLQDFALAVCRKPSRGSMSAEVNGLTRVCIRRGLLDAVRKHTGRHSERRFLLATSPFDALTEDVLPAQEPVPCVFIGKKVRAAVAALPSRQREMITRTVLGEELLSETYRDFGFSAATTAYAHRSEGLRAVRKAVGDAS